MTRVLGLDPGTRICGYGVIDWDQRTGGMQLVECGTLEPGAGGVVARLAVLRDDAAALVREFRPDEAALELAHVRFNMQTALRIAEARGVLIGVLSAAKVPFEQYQPSSIKLSAAGSGKASKEQVAVAVGRVLHLSGNPPLDATDALATAICRVRRWASSANLIG